MSETTEHDNMVSAPILMALIRKEAKLEKAKKAAGAALNAHHKEVKTYGLKIRNFRSIYDQIGAGDNGDEFIQDLREQQRLAKLLKLPIGHQFDIIDDFDVADREKDDDPEATHYFKHGLRAFLAGEPEEDCPHDAGTEAFNDWTRGFRFAEASCKEGEEAIAAMDGEDDQPDAADGTKPLDKKTNGKG